MQNFSSRFFGLLVILGVGLCVTFTHASPILKDKSAVSRIISAENDASYHPPLINFSNAEELNSSETEGDFMLLAMKAEAKPLGIHLNSKFSDLQFATSKIPGQLVSPQMREDLEPGVLNSRIKNVPSVHQLAAVSSLNMSKFSSTPVVTRTAKEMFSEWRYGELFSTLSNETKPALLYEDVHLILNKEVEQKIDYFKTVIPDRFQEWLTRFYGYRPVVIEIFREFGLPEKLAYLSVIESGFNPRAYSRSRASGPWQFMKGTGQLYGLRVNWYLDERRDPIRSSVAAAQHLRDLYDRFGAWPLALAAYNAGEGKIRRAIKKSGTQDYWKIAKTRYIRRETRHYVPKFIAATMIAMKPNLFGFSADTKKLYKYEEVLLKNTIHLRSIAKASGIPFEELRRLNPELRRSITPPDKQGYYLKIPIGMKSKVQNVRSKLKLWVQSPTKIYRVRRGDSLSVIGQRFGMSVRKLKKLNNISGSLIFVNQRLKVRKGTVSGEYVKWYRVRRGDSLWTIAKRFSVTITHLKMLNNIRGSLIQVGRLLLINP